MDTDTMTATLSMPTPEMAQRLLAQVVYEKRLVGVRMAAMGGANPTSLHSLLEVASFIHVGDYEEAMRDNKATVGFIDPAALSRWIDEVLEDPELAAGVRERAVEGAFYGAVAMSVKELLAERVGQCKSVLAPATTHEDD